MAQELADGIAPHVGMKVGVLTFPYFDNRSSEGSLIISDSFQSYLALDKRLSLVERHRINDLLAESHLSETGILDPRTRPLLGKVLGADIIVTGTLIDLTSEKTEINARAIFSSNGRIIRTARALIDRTWGGKLTLGWLGSTEKKGKIDPMRMLARKISKPLKFQKESGIAVLNFIYPQGRLSTGSYLYSERMITYFSQCGIPVVERRLIPKILEEQFLWTTGAVSIKDLKKIGQIVGVEILLVGTLQDLSEIETKVDVRLIKVATGEILGASSIVAPRLWKDNPQLPRRAQINAVIPFVNPPLRSKISVRDDGPRTGGVTTNRMSIKGKVYRPAPVPVPFIIPRAGNTRGGGLTP